MQSQSSKRFRGPSSYEVGSTSESSAVSSTVTPRQNARRRSLLQSRLADVVSEVVSVVDDVCRPCQYYIDLGSCTEICQFCGAYFWLEERVTSFPKSVRPRFNRCCRGGRLVLDYPSQPPDLLVDLFSDPGFLRDVRAYNAMFAMTSFGASVDDGINNGSGPYVFKVSGQVSHWLGTICPPPGEAPRFLQMYIFDGENEISNRMRFFPNIYSQANAHDIVASLSTMLNEVNEYVKLFRSARELCTQVDVPEFVIRLRSRVVDRIHENPTCNTFGAIVCDNYLMSAEYDVVIRSKNGTPHRVSKLHPCYMPLQYPLLFPRGEQGWSPDLRLSMSPLPVEGNGNEVPTPSEDQKITPIMYYAYQMHDRENVYTHVLRASKLFQQYLVDAYICVEHCRLEYYRTNQDEFRCEFLQGVHDAISRGDTEASNIGKRVILPSSFTGGPRYMYKHYQDALAICRVHGNPQYFITFTCNVLWPEITREMKRYKVLSPQDRPDIISRVFQMKVRSFIKYLRTSKPFGDVTADLYTIEFQKRGLPHCHTLLWVSNAYSVRSPEQVDRYISAVIPDPVSQPDLYKTVAQCMLHGPCGVVRRSSPCMKDGLCSKKFPKPYEGSTRFDNAGYVHYKRPPDSQVVLKSGIPLDNGYVVPYNPDLLLRFDAHINVEYCGWTMLIKYLFKYISKGADRIHFTLRQSLDNSNTDCPQTVEVVDEISNFTDSRFICPHEASWRIFGFPIHHRNPPVQVLAVHLEGRQNLTFRQSQRLEDVTSNPNVGKTTLTEWFVNNAKEYESLESGVENGLDLRYIDYLSKYRWETGSKTWSRRKTKREPTIGRLTYVHPTCGELFDLRILLSYQKGSRSFLDLRSVDAVLFQTYREACERLGLIGDDKEWGTTLNEASIWATPRELRSLFVYMILYCGVSNPFKLWLENWKCMSDDISRQICQVANNQAAFINDDDLQQYILHELQILLIANSTPHSLHDFGLPCPTTSSITVLQNSLLLEEKNYDRKELEIEHRNLHTRLHPEQLAVYDTVLTSINNSTQVLSFIYGHGGTGKTYLWKTIIAALRSKGLIVLAVAASGIASLLLPSGRTAHSRFKIPLELTEESVCHIKKKTNLSQLLLETSLIIWDEAPMSDRRCFESLDKTLKDITGNTSQHFGGKSILLGGDFRQTLPIKPQSTKGDIIASCLPCSYLWKCMVVYKLNNNMRVMSSHSTLGMHQNLQEFSEWLLRIGDGDEGEIVDVEHPDVRKIEIPKHLLLETNADTLKGLIRFVYDDNLLLNPDPVSFSERAIICPKNETADDINEMVQSMCPGECMSYFSTDSMVPHTTNGGEIEAMYPTEYLNVLNFSGIPAHRLTLKQNSPIMLMRNMDQKNGLCNGTRLLVSQLLPRVIEARVITGTAIGHRVYIPRINFVHNTKDLPFVFTRRQFPIKMCYAMTINKSQGQSLRKVGIYLPSPVFSHGQLYVALLRAMSPESLKILIESSETNTRCMTLNIVYKELLDDIHLNQV